MKEGESIRRRYSSEVKDNADFDGLHRLLKFGTVTTGSIGVRTNNKK